jgi:ADP-ribosylglycohydrolase
MLGAICGDILGSTYEFGAEKTENISKIALFREEDHFTDDTVLTLAVADWLLHDIAEDYYNDERLKDKLAHRFLMYSGKQYRDREIAYGISYVGWLDRFETTGRHLPYHSYGNGSAMRVSPVAWAFDTLEEVRRFARLSADVTHNHPEGEKGAEAAASAVFLARRGLAKESILQYVRRAFGYPLNKSVAELRVEHEFSPICQNTLPQALMAMLEGESYEETVRLSISYGGDSDTIAAVAGAVAEALYGGVPDSILAYCKEILDDHAIEICSEFHNRFQTPNRQ